jgi:hypothetical protein
MSGVVMGLLSTTVVCTIVFVIIYTPYYVVQHEPMDPYSVAERVLTSSPLVDGQVIEFFSVFRSLIVTFKQT